MIRSLPRGSSVMRPALTHRVQACCQCASNTVFNSQIGAHVIAAAVGNSLRSAHMFELRLSRRGSMASMFRFVEAVDCGLHHSSVS
jgi:hypothetical protein